MSAAAATATDADATAPRELALELPPLPPSVGAAARPAIASASDGVHVSIVIPMNNEVDNVDALLSELLEQAWMPPTIVGTVEVLAVDDGSNDGTGERLRTWADRDLRVHAILLTRPRGGKERALFAGFDAARGKAIVMMDGDRQNDPADIPRLLEALAEHHLVGGMRGRRRRGWFRALTSRIANGVRNWALGERVADAGCGLRAYRREAIAVLPRVRGFHRFVMSIARFHGLSVTEVPVNDRERVAGRAKYGLGRAFTTWRDLLWVRRYRKLVATAAIKEVVHAGSSAMRAPPAKGTRGMTAVFAGISDRKPVSRPDD